MRLIVTVGAALVFGGCRFADMGPSDRFKSDFHYTYKVQPNARVNAETFDGSIEIAGWDQNKVEILGTKYGVTEALRDAVKIDVRHAPDAVEIRAVKPSSDMGASGARFTIHVPRQAMLDRISASNGLIKVRDVAGAAHLKSSNGSVAVSNVGGNVDAQTSNGTVEADTIQGGATLRTSNGRIRVDGVSGPLDAKTSNGSISARVADPGKVTTKLVTTNGAIDLSLTGPPKGDIRAETVNSAITLHMPADSGAHLIADTSNGTISSDFPINSKAGGDEDKKHVEGTIGAGGPAIELSTSNSSIHILSGLGVKSDGN